MRINRYIALGSGLSRRAADAAIAANRVRFNGELPTAGQTVTAEDMVTLDGQQLTASIPLTTIILHKPIGYVCSRRGQGSSTIYELLPSDLQHLKPVGRLDKDSSGLLLLTNDGNVAHELMHPRFQKTKVYQVVLDKPLNEENQSAIEQAVQLEDGPSHLKLNGTGTRWVVTMHEGRNRQIRRTFAALGYQVAALHRTQFDGYTLEGVPSGQYRHV